MEIGDRIASSLFPKSRRAVLGLLFGQPDRAFYLREVVDLTGLGVGHAQRELKRLTEAGIIVRSEQGRHVYFQANEHCPIYVELRGIVTKTVGAVAVVREALAPLADRIVAAYVYGSGARGVEQQTSDLDVMIIGDATFSEVVDAVRAAEPKLHRNINPTVYPVDEFTEKLAARHHFVTTVMKRDKVFVLGNEDEFRRLFDQPLDSNA
ncbi:MAG: nucleotidyltransferase domain-containing protein [Planctomycetota bacterium]|jgi:predicted nucleotidyltransferase